MTQFPRARELGVTSRIDPRLRTTSLCLAVGTGARHDPADNGGLAHLLEHLLMSVPLAGAPPVSEQVERLGGDANAETGPEMMLFTAQVHAEDAEEVTDLLLRAVLEPELDETILDRERSVVLQELAAAAADPADVVQDLVLADLFPGHPLGRPVGGTAEQVRAATLPDVLSHHGNRFLASPMTLVVVGPEVPGSAQRQRRLPRLVTENAFAVREPAARTEPEWPDEFSWLCAGAYAPPADDVRYLAYNLLGRLMGSSPASPLYRRLRSENGLVYAFQAWSRGYTDNGAWRLLAGVDAGNGPALLRIAREVLGELATHGPDPADLAAVRRQAEMRLVRDAEIPAELARLVASRGRAGVVDWSEEAELAAISTVTSADIRAAAEDVLEHLRPVVAA